MSDLAADVVVVGLGVAGGCAAIAAHDAGADVLVIEKQPAESHYSNTRMSGGGYHSPSRDGDVRALKDYALAMFSGDNLPLKLEGEQPEFAEELAELWARHAPDNEPFMRSLDPLYKTVRIAGAAYADFPGAAASGYAVVKSTYTGTQDERRQFSPTIGADKAQKESGEAFHACLMTGVQSRGIAVLHDSAAEELIQDASGAVTGLRIRGAGRQRTVQARRGVILASGGYEYNPLMRRAFLDGPALEGWAFYGSPANTGDGIRMALRAGAAMSHAGSVAGRVICAIPVRRNGLRLGLNTNGVGKPHEIVVDNEGRRYASERRITKDPSRYIFYKEALHFDTHSMTYPRIPSWMVFDSTLIAQGPIVRLGAAAYNGVEWGADNMKAVEQGWILRGDTLSELAARIAAHPDNKARMKADVLAATVASYNAACAAGEDAEWRREPASLGAVEKPPFYAIPLYPGGPNTKGGLRANPQRQVLDWDDRPIPRLYAVGEIASVFQFAYQGGGNLAEGITFGRIAGSHAAALAPITHGVPLNVG